MKEDNWIKEKLEEFDKLLTKLHAENYPFDCWEAFDGYNEGIKQFISQAINQTREETLKEIIEFIKISPKPYMVEATEKRFIDDIKSLKTK